MSDAVRTCLILGAALLPLLLAASAPAAVPDAVIDDPVVEIREATPDRTVLEIRFPATEINVPWERAEDVVWEGVVTETEDPRTRERLRIPAEHTVQVAVPDLRTPRWRVVSQRWHRTPADVGESLVTAGEPLIHRGVALAGLTVRPESGGGILAAVVVAIDHPAGDRSKALPVLAPGHRSASETIPSAVVNADVYRRWRQLATDRPSDRDDGAAKAIENDAFALTDNWVRLEIDAEGVHRLTGAELEAAGVTLASIDPLKVRLFRGGGLTLGDDPVEVEAEQPGRTGLTELAVELRGMDDQEWNADDDLLFYGFGAAVWTDRFDPDAERLDHFEHLQQPTGVYWLTWENDVADSPFATAPLRVSTIQTQPNGVPARTTHLARYHGEQSEAYVGGWLEDFWAWDAVINSAFTRAFELDGIVPGSEASFWMEVSGLYTNQFGARFEVLGYFNDSAAVGVAHDWTHAEWTLEGGVRFGGTTNALNRGTNSVRLRYENYDDLNAFVAFDLFQLEYTATLDKGDYTGELICALWGEDLDQPGTAVDLEFTIPGIADYQLWDITGPAEVRRLQGDETGGASRTLTVGITMGPADDRHFMLFDESDLRPVTTVERADVTPLRQTVPPVDYLVIHPAEFSAAAEELAALRSRVLPGVDDPRAAAVAIEDIYAGFSGGQKDWRAIRQFLRWNYYQQGQRLRWVCLLGDASIDYRNIFGREPGVGLFDWIPTDLISSFPRVPYPVSIYEPYTADESLVALDSPPIGSPYYDIPDLAIGRLPARSSSDAMSLVQKIATFVENPPDGTWKNKVLISADDMRRSSGDPAPNEEDHTIQAEVLATDYVPLSLEVQKLYLIEYPVIGIYKPDGRRDLLSWLNEGTTMFYYVGHGAAVTLADEHLFEITDISGLGNGDKRFVFMAFSCDVGVYADPNSQCMAEDFLTASQGGGIASIAASWVSYSSLNDLLSSAVFANYYPGQGISAATSVGEALTAGKAEMWPTWSRVRNARRYNVMGDPAIRPPNPVDDLGFTDASADSLLTGRLHTVQVDLDTEDLEHGPGTTYQLRAEESRVVREFVDFRGFVHEYFAMPRPVFRGHGALDAPETMIPFLVPQSMRTGENGRVRIIVDDGSGVPHAGAETVPVVQVPSSSGGDASGPQVQLAFDNNRIRVQPGTELEATLFDTSGVNIVATNPANSVLLEFDRSGIYNNVSDDVQFESGSYTRARLSTRLPGDLALGEHIVVMTASDMFGNVGSDTLGFTLEAAGVGGMRDATVFPNPTRGPCRLLCDLSGPMTLQWDIYTVSGRRIRRVEDTFGAAGPAALEWDGRDGEGDRIANGVYLYVLRGRMPGDEHEFRETGQLVIMR